MSKDTALELIDFDFTKNALAKKADQQLKAFQHYYAMGEKRDLTVLAQMTGIPKSELKAWEKRYNWRRRIDALDSKVIQYIDEKFADLYSETKAICTQTIFDLLRTAQEDIEAGHIRITSIKDLETIVKMDMLLKGEATERRESKNLVVSLKKDMKNMSAEELNEILNSPEED